MPSIKYLCEKLNWAYCRRISEFVEKVKNMETSKEQTSHYLTVKWNAESATVASRRGGERTLWVHGTATGDVAVGECYIAANGNFVFLPKDQSALYMDEHGTDANWDEVDKLKLPVFVNGERICDECKISFAPAREWKYKYSKSPDLEDWELSYKTEHDSVLQALAPVKRSFMAHVAKECGLTID